VPTLVVIDMQEQFETATVPRLVGNVLELIGSAMEKGWGIVVLEINGNNLHPTLSIIREKLRGYNRHLICSKSVDDGSMEVSFVCKEEGYDTSEFYVCGVITNQCVAATVIGLSRRFEDAKIRVVKKCCRTFPCHADKLRNLVWTRSLKNVSRI